MSLLQAHAAVADPHGDRAYADEKFVPRVGDVVGKSRIVDKAADEPRTSIVLIDDGSLSLPVTGTGRYALEGFLLADGDAEAGMSLTFTAPDGSTGSWVPLARQSAGGTIQNGSLDYGTAATVEVTADGVAVAPRGSVIVGSTGGAVTLQWAPAATPSRALVLRAGSWLKLTRTG
jgi:hypothetical protein